MMKEEMQQEEQTEKIEDYLIGQLISCEKCHLCNTDCPVFDYRITRGSFGINRAIYYGLKWNRFSKELRDLVYSCATCGKCEVTCKHVSRALPLVDIFEKARELLFVEKMIGPMPDQRDVIKNYFQEGKPMGLSSEGADEMGGGSGYPICFKGQ